MIKGKFYTGLTSDMMNRSRVVNRQQTHFFWPDETDSESVTSRSKRTVTKPSTPVAHTNNNNTDNTQSNFTTKDLARKQLSSGIQFYDNVNAKTPEARRRRFKKIDNINLNNNDVDFQPEKKKLETFSSKIEFYDFEPQFKAKNDKPVKAANVGKNMPIKNVADVRYKEEIKPKNDSPDVTKKRISFITEEKPVERTKSILKNSEEKSPVEKVLVKPLPKRGLLPKNLSKSVENISKMAKQFDESVETKPEKLSTIIKEVKNLNLSNERSHNIYNDYDKDENDSYHRGSNRIESRRNNTDRDYDQRYPDRYESRGYREDRYRNDDRGQNELHKYNNRYEDYEDRDHGYDRGVREERNDRYENHRYERTQRDSYSQPPRDTYEYRERSRRHVESPVRERHSPNYNRQNEAESEQRTSIRDTKPASRKPIDQYYDEPTKRTILHEDDEYSASISQKPQYVPHHLRTNILSNGKVRPQTQRPMSVRNSAVTRVGVGLPDYE